MTDLLESTSERLVYKAYSAATIDPRTEPLPATDPATSGGQILRHVDHNFSLGKDAYTADEKRTDKQQPMEKHGTRRVPFTINGLLSCGTQKDLFQAVLGGTWTSSLVTADNTDFTSVAADSAASTFTFAGGNPVTKGYKVGDIWNFAGLSESADNATNYVVLGFGGTSNRTVTVYPPPTTMSADLSFTMTNVGNSLSMPSSSHVKRKYAFEVNNADGDISRLFTECRLSGFDFSIAPNQDARIAFSGLGRNRKVYDSANAPFFTAPTVETTSDVISSMDALLYLNGTIVGVASGLSIKFNRAPSGPAQLNKQGLTAGILLANAVITGDFTLFVYDRTFYDLFDDPTSLAATEFGLISYLPTTADIAAPAMVFFLPRVKINSNTEQVIEGAKALQCAYAAARYFGSAAGVDSTSIRIVDTAV